MRRLCRHVPTGQPLQPAPAGRLTGHTDARASDTFSWALLFTSDFDSGCRHEEALVDELSFRYYADVAAGQHLITRSSRDDDRPQFQPI